MDEEEWEDAGDTEITSLYEKGDDTPRYTRRKSSLICPIYNVSLIYFFKKIRIDPTLFLNETFFFLGFKSLQFTLKAFNMRRKRQKPI